MLAAEVRPPLAAYTQGADGAALRALIVVLPLLPVVSTLLQVPESGIISDSFAKSAWFGGPLWTSLGFAASVSLEALALGFVEGLIMLPVATATFMSTVNQPNLLDAAPFECDVYCTMHSVAVSVLMIGAVVGLRTRGAGWGVVGAVAMLSLALAVAYVVVINGSGFNARDDGTREVLAAIGTAEVCVFLFERSFVAALPVRARAGKVAAGA